jgi:hypothetical protein
MPYKFKVYACKNLKYLNRCGREVCDFASLQATAVIVGALSELPTRSFPLLTVGLMGGLLLALLTVGESNVRPESDLRLFYT